MTFDPHGRCNFCGNRNHIGHIKHVSNSSSHLYSGTTDPIFVPLVKREHLYLNTVTDSVFVYNPLHGWTYLMTLSESGNSASLHSPTVAIDVAASSSLSCPVPLPPSFSTIPSSKINELTIPSGKVKELNIPPGKVIERPYFEGERISVGQVTSISPKYLNVDGDNINEPVLSVNYDGVGLLGITWSVTISNTKVGDTIYLATHVNGETASEIIETFDSPKIFSRIFNDFIIMNSDGNLDFFLTWHSDNEDTTITIDPHLGNHVTLWFQGH